MRYVFIALLVLGCGLIAKAKDDPVCTKNKPVICVQPRTPLPPRPVLTGTKCKPGQCGGNNVYADEKYRYEAAKANAIEVEAQRKVAKSDADRKAKAEYEAEKEIANANTDNAKAHAKANKKRAEGTAEAHKDPAK